MRLPPAGSRPRILAPENGERVPLQFSLGLKKKIRIGSYFSGDLFYLMKTVAFEGLGLKCAFCLPLRAGAKGQGAVSFLMCKQVMVS